MTSEPPQALLDQLPRLYQTEKTEIEETIIRAHFFIGACDWWVAEFDGEDLFFGYVNLGDPINAEWGYFKLSALRATQIMADLRDAKTGQVLGKIPVEVEWDQYWKTKAFKDIKITGDE